MRSPISFGKFNVGWRTFKGLWGLGVGVLDTQTNWCVWGSIRFSWAHLVEVEVYRERDED